MLFLQRHIARLARAPPLHNRAVSSASYPAATRTATTAFFQRHGHMPHAIVPKTSIAVSRVGFGAYRVNRSTEEHKLAILEAVRSGVNVIDTSAHFENGASEEVIGEALKELFSGKSFTREQLFLISKAGYLQRSDISILDPSEYVQINDKHFHSLAPAVLEAQIMGSLRRLGVDRLDLFMLNSPERMMLANNKQFTKSEVYKSIHLALRHLDHEVSRGRISSYGVCSNSMANPGAPDHISLSQILDDLGHSAENFVAVESPFNLFERGVVSGGGGRDAAGMEIPLAKIAAERNVYLFINRPLTAIAGNQIRALVNPSTAEPAISEQELLDMLTKNFEDTTVLEANISEMLPVQRQTLATKFVWGHALAENFSVLSQNHFATKHYLQQQVEPAVRRDLAALEDYAAQLSDEDEKEECRQWIKQYEKQIQTLITHLTTYTRLDHYRKNSDLDRVLCAVCPSLAHTLSAPHSPLSVKSLRVLLANQGVGTVLVGMRARAYVADAVMAARMEGEKTLEREAVEDVFACPLLL